MGLLIALLVILGVGAWVHFDRIQREFPEGDGAAPLISEAALVTADFLEAGQVAALLSEGNYLGTISVRLQHRNHNQAGYVITMYDTGNLCSFYEAYRQSHPSQGREDFRVLERFLEHYGDCYDAERNALVYATKHSARLTDALEGETELRSRIALHPLAEMKSLAHIHTKYVGKP